MPNRSPPLLRMVATQAKLPIEVWSDYHRGQLGGQRIRHEYMRNQRGKSREAGWNQFLFDDESFSEEQRHGIACASRL